MKYKLFYKHFVEIVRQKYPKGSPSTKHIAEHLGIDQKGFSRRMRGVTPFTMQEIVKVCALLNISLDSLWASFDRDIHPLKVYLRDLSVEEFPDNFRNLLLGMEMTTTDTAGSRLLLCSNLIPNGIMAGYPSLLRFLYFAWTYRRYPNNVKVLDDFNFSAELAQALAGYGENVRKIKHSTYLFVDGFMDNVASYIRVYHETGVLPTEFAEAICQELANLIDELEQVSLSGVWPGTDNRVYMHVTPLCLPNSVLITESEYYKVAVIYSFFINPIINLHPETFEEIKTLANSLLRHAECISGSGEITRVAFFKRQRESLTDLSRSLRL